ncbi:UNVERIFIED_CONTAM: Leukotriene A-4 hydrolase [Gekko kuhli]
MDLACLRSYPFPSFSPDPWFPTHRGQDVVVDISFETSPKSSALQWLAPEQTSGRRHPFLFSQCQAHHCRAVLPCQDTPSVKLTYYAEVDKIKSPVQLDLSCTEALQILLVHVQACMCVLDHSRNVFSRTQLVSVPNELVALMSAKRDGDKPDPEDSTRKIYRFSQPVPVPCYLIALVVGALESREIGPRTLVWAEKELVEKSAYEFAETETMLKIAEDLAGPYVWGHYDLLVLPPSFPYGGMENPCLTFVTPTLLAGDRSLSSVSGYSSGETEGLETGMVDLLCLALQGSLGPVIAHEISHSWTGNLVTNKTWEHFWLNEGHTVYLERRIGGRLFGEQFRQFQALGGWRELQNTINTLGGTNPLTNLIPNLKEVDPDVAYSSVPYEKGSALLLHLEQLLGGPDIFIGFLRAYIQQFAYKSIMTDDWKNFLYSYFKDKVDVLDTVDWNAWLNTPGMPPVKPQYDMTLSNACVALSQRWIKANESDLSSFNSADIEQMSSHQLIEFLALLLLENPLPLNHVRRMQEVYNFNAVNNFEIRFRWLRLCIQAKWEDAIPLALKMATEQGRMKFTRPLFKDLYKFDQSRDQAVSAFQQHQARMHPVTAMLVARDLEVAGQTA